MALSIKSWSWSYELLGQEFRLLTRLPFLGSVPGLTARTRVETRVRVVPAYTGTF